MSYRGFDHITMNVSDLKVSGPFYDKLLKFLGFKKVEEKSFVCGWVNKINGVWLVQTRKGFVKNKFRKSNPGIYHIAFRAESKKDVDKFYNEFIRPNKVRTLYGKPKHYPEYHKTYYAVFFEDPEGIKLEVMSIFSDN